MAGTGPDGALTANRAAGTSDGPPGSRAHPDGLVDERRRRRRAAEAAATAAEAAAAAAATRASDAIAAASRAAAEAEAAADAAARAADEAEAAATAERAAVAQARAANAGTANETTAVGTAPIGLPRIGPPPIGLPPIGPSPAGMVPAGTAPAGTAPNGSRRSGPPLAVSSQADRMAAAEADTMTLPAVAPATGGRAARRRAQEAADAVAQEATRDPATQALAVGGPGADASGPDAPGHGPDAPGDGPPRRNRRSKVGAGRPVTRAVRAVRAQVDNRALLTASAVAAVLALAAVLGSVLGGSPSPSPTALVASEPRSSAAADPATAPSGEAGGAVDPTGPKAVAYLAALRAAGVPTSASGQAEAEAAAVICEQLASGAAAADLVDELPAVLPTVNSKQARSVVSLAQKNYC